jgi:hypothetical protein
MSEQDQRASRSAGVTIVVDPHCADIFVDGVVGATVRDGIVRMNLVNIRTTADGSQQEHAVVGRLILSRSAVRNLHTALGQVMTGLSRRDDRPAPDQPDADTE